MAETETYTVEFAGPTHDEAFVGFAVPGEDLADMGTNLIVHVEADSPEAAERKARALLFGWQVCLCESQA